PPATSPAASARSGSCGPTRSACRCSWMPWPTAFRPAAPGRGTAGRPAPRPSRPCRARSTSPVRRGAATASRSARCRRARRPGGPRGGWGGGIDGMRAGEPLWVHGTVRSLDGRPLAGAELDVWQNGDNELYAVQDPEAPETHLRGRFTAREDGSYGFITVRPT